MVVKGEGVLGSVKRARVKLLLLFLLSVIGPVVIGFVLAKAGYMPAVNLFTVSPATTSAEGSSGTKILVDPPEVVNVTLQAGSTFSVNLTVSNVTDLFAWQVNLSWNPSILNVTAITFGDFLAGQPEGTSTSLGVPATFVDNATGYAMFGETTIGEHPGVNGSGWLATVEFLVVGYGDTVLNINSTRTTPLDSTLKDLEFTAESGYFSNRILSDIRGPEGPPDGVVDGWDYAFVGLAFGKTSADPDWDDYKIADIRGPVAPDYPPDGVVDGWDYSFVGLQFGESVY